MLNKLQIKTIRDIEALLKAEGINPCHKLKALKVLSDSVVAKYVTHTYNTCVWPLYLYLDYANNFLSVERFAEYYDLELKQAHNVINFGRIVLDEINK